MTVKARPMTWEVIATYAVEELSMDLVIQLATNHPLGVITVDSGQKVGVSQSQWRNWMLQLTTFLTHQVKRQLTDKSTSNIQFRRKKGQDIYLGEMGNIVKKSSVLTTFFCILTSFLSVIHVWRDKLWGKYIFSKTAEKCPCPSLLRYICLVNFELKGEKVHKIVY